MMPFPCKGCEKRKVGCHGSCEEYQASKRANDERLKRKLAERAATPQFNENTLKRKWRDMRRK